MYIGYDLSPKIHFIINNMLNEIKKNIDENMTLFLLL